MLYLDSSVLIKAYLKEAGSALVVQKLTSGERLYTSALSYAEVFASFGRKRREGFLNEATWQRLCEEFTREWMTALNELPVDSKTMSAVESLVARHALRGADTIHLSAALWLRDRLLVSPEFAAGDKQVEFCTADKRLAEFANREGLLVFLPQ